MALAEGNRKNSTGGISSSFFDDRLKSDPMVEIARENRDRFFGLVSGANSEHVLYTGKTEGVMARCVTGIAGKSGRERI